MVDLSLLHREVFGVNLLSVYHGKVDPPAGVVCRVGMKEYERFYYVVSGCAVFEVSDGRTLIVPAGGTLYLPTNCEYRSRWEMGAQGEYYGVNFLLQRAGGDLCSPGERMEVILQSASKKYETLYRHFHEVWVSGSVGHEMGCIRLFWELVQNLYVDMELGSMKSEYASIYKSIVHLQNSYQTDISTEELARMCGMSLTAFRREFKARTGTSPVKYKNALRMEKARQLLSTGEYNVTEVSRLVGCPDIYYFNKLFNRSFHANPSEWIPK